MPVRIGGQPEHGFDEPLGLLSDCHRRIERFLGVLVAVARGERGAALGAEARDAVERSLAYFRRAGPLHTRDEEEDLFPLLRACAGPGAAELAAAVAELERDHEVADQGHARVDALASRWLEAGSLARGEAEELVRRLEELERHYARHIEVEDRQVFPAAARMLGAHELEELGRRMAARRELPFRGPIGRFLSQDHERLNALLLAAAAGGDSVRQAPFAAFRAGILKHVAMEEKLLVPAARLALGREIPVFAPLHADHGLIAALLVPTPTLEIVETLRGVFRRHDPHEEEPGGLYDICDRALGAVAALRLVQELRAFPEVRLSEFRDGPRIAAHLVGALERSRRAWEAWERRVEPTG